MRRERLLLIAAVVSTAGCTSPGGFGGPVAGDKFASGMPPTQMTSNANGTPGMLPTSPQMANPGLANARFANAGLAGMQSPAPNPASPIPRIVAAVKNNPISRMISPGAPIASGAQNMPAPAQNIPNRLDPISLDYRKVPPNPQLYVSMAEVSESGGNDTQARQMYQKAIAIDPKHVPALVGLARLEDRQHRLDAAQQLYRQAVTVNPQDPAVLNDLALCLARKGDLQTSLAMLEQVVRLQPQKPLYRNNIAKVLVELNRQNEAYTHLAAVHPPAIANYNLGYLLNQRGRPTEAIQYLSTACRIDPQMQPAQALLATLSQQPTHIAQRQKIEVTKPQHTRQLVAQQPNSPPGGKAIGQTVSNGKVLPTPYGTMQTQVGGGQPGRNQPGVSGPGMRAIYPATGVPPVVEIPAVRPQELPATTSPLSVESAPLLLPPVQ